MFVTMSKKKILIVEDDKDIARLVQYNLDKAGYACEVDFWLNDTLVKDIIGGSDTSH